MKVRVLSALLAFCLVLTMVPAVGAVDGVTASTPSARSSSYENESDAYFVAADVTVLGSDGSEKGDYDSLTSAFAYATTNDVVRLNANVQLNGSVLVDEADMDMARTLDGNGMEIATAYGVAGDVALYVTAGMLNVQNVILADNVDLVVSGGTVNILSGTYNGEVSASSGTLSITGGTFSTDVSDYVAEGFEPQQNGSVWNVVQSTVSAAPAAPYVVVPDTIDPSDAATVTESAGTIAADDETAASMTQEATDAAADLTDDDKQQYLEAGKEQLTALPDVTPEQVAAAVLVTVPSIKIEVEAYTVGSSFRVDITPTVQFAVAVDPDDIQMGTNAVSVGENTLDMTDVSVTLSITLPTGFVQDTTTPIFVEHSGYAYRGTLESVSAGIQLTFTNPGHGFSPHEIRLDSPVAEPVDETVPYSYYSYDTALADTEVDAIRLLEAPTTPLTVNRAMTISAAEGIDLTTAVTAGTGFEIQQNSDGSISVVSETAETYILTVADVQNGSIAIGSGATETGDGTYTVTEGAAVTITATPNTGYYVSAIRNGTTELLDAESVVQTSTPQTVTLTPVDDCEISAVFTQIPDEEEPDTYTFTVQQVEGGIIEVTSDNVTDLGDGSYSVAQDAEVTVTATADEGFHLNAFLVGSQTIETDGSDAGTYTFTVDQDGMEVSAYFERDDMPPSQDSYTITVEPSDYGTITLTGAGEPDADGKYTVAANTEVTATVTANDGYRFDALLVNGEIYTTSPQSFTVTGDTTVSANFTLIDDTPDTPSGGGSSGTGGSGRYNISVPSTAHGSISLDRENAAYGTLVTITVRPDAGYELGTLTVTDRNGNEVEVEYEGGNEYSFRMPNSRVSIEATFVASGAASTGLPFTDVASSAWYYDAVRFVYENGLMNGVSATSFGPNQTTSRGMIVTILYRLEGEPAVAGSTFSDVASNAYYANAIAWASANGIVNGYGNGTFQPNRAISREEMATILYRYASYKGYSVTTNGSLSGYTDADQVSAYALEAMRWANENNLVTGTTVTTLAPTTGSTRAVAATILMRFINSFAQ